ncbi:MAG: tRNA dihydrouridine synthase DusB [Chlamydiales bacterium]
MKKDLRTPIHLGYLKLSNRIFFAPLAGCSDFPFRKMSTRLPKIFRPGLMFCEMVKMDALVRNDPNTFRLLDYSADMHPIGAQICGSNPKLAGQAAKIIEELGFDSIDLNCGCPVDKVTKDGSGSGMLKNPDLIAEMVANMVASVSLPVTVKIRAGWDEDLIVGPEITQKVEEAGAVALTCHGRTRKQAYRGPANWGYIKDCVSVAKNIKIIGNGDIFQGSDALDMIEQTGCDAVLVSRGTMGNPWIVEDILHAYENDSPIDRLEKDLRDTLTAHFLEACDYSGKRAVLDVRRIGCWYFKKSPGTRQFREKISRVASIEDARELIESFSFVEENNG